MLLQLKAKHFKDTKFVDYTACPIAEAFKDQTGLDAIEAIFYLVSNHHIFNHEKYDYDNFLYDRVQANVYGFNDTVIREIELTEE